MKIAFVSQPFEYIEPGVTGGSIGIWTDRIVHALAPCSGERLIYAKKFAGQLDGQTDGGVIYRRFSIPVDDWTMRAGRLLERILNFPLAKKPFFSSRFAYHDYGLQIANDLRQRDYDLVHIHNFSQFVPIIRALNPEIKIVLHMHCEWLTQLDKQLIERRLAETDLVLGCSDFITGQIRSRFPRFAHRCRTVLNGVDLNQFVPSDAVGSPEDHQQEYKHLLFVGRISPEKGIHVLLKAFEIVVSQYPQVQLDIVGSPGSAPFDYIVLVSDDPAVKGLSKFYTGILKKDHYFLDLKSSLTDETRTKVNFIGAVPHEQVPACYRRAEILINPSLSEAFGMSLVEAMACQVPVVASSIGGMTEIINHSENGLLVEPDNPSALAQAILSLLSDPSRLKRMGASGYRRIAPVYSWDRIGANLWENYRETLEGRGA